MVGHLLWVAALLMQQAPQITVGIRPNLIRVGERTVLTVRVLSARGLPEFVDFLPPSGLVLEDVRDRVSAGVGRGSSGSWVLERDLDLLAEAPGEYALPPVQVVVAGVTTEAPSPALTVAAIPLNWPRRPQERRGETRRDRRNPDPVVPQGTPPPAGEMREAQPQVQGGYQPWGYPGYSPSYPGQNPALPWIPPGQIPGLPWILPGQLPGVPWLPAGQLPGWGGGQGQYPGYGYSPVPYGPNGGWPIAPPGASPGGPGMGQAGGWGAPWGYSGSGAYPGGGGGQSDPPTLPAIPGGQWPVGMGGGWAETAASDPWWPEIVPELYDYAVWTQAPGGGASLGAGITPTQLFVGQQATLVATATFPPGAFLATGAAPEYLPPTPPDFWAVDLPDAQLPLPTAAQFGVGQGYTFRRAFFPLRAGDYLVPSAALLLPRGGGGPGGLAWDTLATDPIPVSVLPAPQAPGLPGYAGAVGRYRLEAGVTPARLAVGETAFLVVRILGVGNVRALSPPQVGPVFGAEMAPAGDGAVLEVRDGVVGGVRTFTWLVVPTEPGPLRIDPILFAFFDPYLGDFGQVASEEIFLEVTEFPGGL